MRPTVAVLRSICIARSYRVMVWMTHTVRMRRACAYTISRFDSCCGYIAGNMALHLRPMLCRRRHRHRHHVPGPSAQRRKSDQEDEEPVAHEVVTELRVKGSVV